MACCGDGNHKCALTTNQHKSLCLRAKAAIALTSLSAGARKFRFNFKHRVEEIGAHARALVELVCQYCGEVKWFVSCFLFGSARASICHTHVFQSVLGRGFVSVHCITFNMSRLLTLPDDLFISALDHLAPRDIFEFTFACRRHFNLLFAAPPTVLSERLWRCICRHALPGLAPDAVTACESWRSLLNSYLQAMGADRFALYAPVKRVWMRLERWLAANMPMTSPTLLPGAPAAEIRRIESSMPAGFRLPLDYLVSCHIHQGCARHPRGLLCLHCLQFCSENLV
jgi:hypothetical protein